MQLFAIVSLFAAPSAAFAQDSGSPQQPQPTSPPVRVIQEDFRLQPSDQPTRLPRNEPVVRALPTPTPSASSGPTASQTPRIAVPPVAVQPEVAPSRNPQRRSSERVVPTARQGEGIAPRTVVPADPPATGADADPASSSGQSDASAEPYSLPTFAPPQEQSAETIGKAEQGSWLVWLLPAVLAFLGIGLVAFWFVRRRPESVSTIERIEPYRPVERPQQHTATASEPPSTPIRHVPGEQVATTSGLVQAKGGMGQVLTGTGAKLTQKPGDGFVTINPAAKQREQAEQVRRRSASGYGIAPNGQVVLRRGPSGGK